MVDRLVNSEANARRISMVESCFGKSGKPLAVPGRVLVGEGVLTKMCRKKPKARQFFLFNDILVYGNILLNKKKYNKQHLIPLEEIKLESLNDEGHLRNGWLIRTTTKSFAVYAATSTEKQEWMAHINKCIEDLLRKSGKKAAEVYAAVWVPDSEAQVCMHCKRNRFTVVKRKHHCRNCGTVVCGACSNKRFVLPNQPNKKERVCLTCFDNLSKAKLQNHFQNNLSARPLDTKERPATGSTESSSEEGSDDDDAYVNQSFPDQPKFYRSANPEAPEENISTGDQVNKGTNIV